MQTPLVCALGGALFLAPLPEASASVSSTQSASAAAQFDLEMLRQRGIDPKLAEYLSEAPRFSPGLRVVDLIVNGVKLGKVDARFGSEGKLCFDENFLRKARLRVPASSYRLGNVVAGDTCYDFVAAYPQTSLTLRPNREQIFLVVPQDAMLGDAPEARDFTTGGTAGILNYDVMSVRSRFGDNKRTATYATTQAGFNAGDWIVRSRQLYSKDGDQQRFNHLYTYAQRTFADQKAVLQAGQINVNSPVFVGAPITGVQLLPEGALYSSTASGALVQGIAQSQATIEVRQAGVLIYTTMVPEGPFALTDIPLMNTGADLEVTVQETNGQSRTFTVSAATFRSSVSSQPGYSLAVGKVREIATEKGASPVVAAANGTWNLNPSTVGSAGIMASARYSTVGSSLDFSFPNANAALRTTFSNASEEGVKGAQVGANFNLRPAESVTVGVSTTQQSSGYRNLSDTLVGKSPDWMASQYKRQYSATTGWSNPTVGSLNATYSTSRAFNGNSSNRLVGSWGKSFDRATVTASVETALGSARNSDRGQSTRGSRKGSNNNAAYVNVSIPIGTRSARAYVSKRGDSTRTGVAMSDIVSDQLNYRLAAERNSANQDTYASANVSAIPRYTSLDLGYSQGGSSSTQSARISGAAVAHKSGVTLSPYAVQDTFGIVAVGDLSGVKLTTPNGPVWTDATGQAVIPHLHAYRSNRVEVQPKSLPRRVDLRNGFQSVEAGRGSVNHLQFDVIKARRILIDAVNEDGKPLPKGSSVLDSNGNFITTVLDKGVVFLTDANPEQALKVSLPNEKTCNLKIDYREENNDDIFYEKAPALCVPA
ncbi:fimbria/pilus outer membrane usher protein [Achromobacter sp. Root565]|uniref:fimbria/pilus outer membrane usher protein n=1 Tax=Achromobacter sp. Root565 TaxID=1736564 RepID=UPI00138F333C|nr:fimbria/pilus outer membrane usher protein [Achromobacter sp. Root565]